MTSEAERDRLRLAEVLHELGVGCMQPYAVTRDVCVPTDPRYADLHPALADRLIESGVTLAASERPPVDPLAHPLRETLRAINKALAYLAPPVGEGTVAAARATLISLRAALASPAVPRPEGLRPDWGAIDKWLDEPDAAAPRPEGLDVERLAEAMDAVFAAGSDFELQHVSKPHPVLAGRIAREYARLSDTGEGEQRDVRRRDCGCLVDDNQTLTLCDTHSDTGEVEK